MHEKVSKKSQCLNKAQTKLKSSKNGVLRFFIKHLICINCQCNNIRQYLSQNNEVGDALQNFVKAILSD